MCSSNVLTVGLPVELEGISVGKMLERMAGILHAIELLLQGIVTLAIRPASVWLLIVLLLRLALLAPCSAVILSIIVLGVVGITDSGLLLVLLVTLVVHRIW